MNEGPFIPTHIVNGVVLNKVEKNLAKDDKENV